MSLRRLVTKVFVNMSDVESCYNKENISWQELLIELVRANPCIYEKSHRDYYDDQGVKANCWKKISDSMIKAGFESIKGDPTSKLHLIIHHHSVTNYI